MILRNLLGRKTRTLLTMAGVSIGVAAVVAMGALADGLAIAYDALGSGSGADLMVAKADAIDIAFSAVDEKVGESLRGVPGVAQVTGMVYTLSSTGDVPYLIVFGYDPQGFAIAHFRIIEGEGLDGQQGRRGGRPLILGRMLADDMDKEVGDTIKLYETTFRIVGIYETGAPMEDSAVVIRLRDAQAISGHPRQLNAFLIKLRNLNDADRVRERITRQFSELTVTTSSDFTKEQDWLSMIQGFTWGISFLAVLIGGVGVMNTMVMSVFERTREFGVLRALGWRPRRVLGMVLGESVMLCGLGGVLGSAMGTAAVLAIKGVPVVSGLLPERFSTIIFARGMGVALALGLVGGLYPAWRASRLMPVEAMRYEGGGSRHAPRIRLGGATLRNLSRQPTRTILTAVGIGTAIAAMVAMGALTDGLVEGVTGAFGEGGAHLIGMQADASIDLSTLDEQVVRRIATLPGVAYAEGFLTGYATVGDLPFFVVFGYYPHGRTVANLNVVEGETLTANRQIVIGRVAAENLKKQVGDTLRIFDRPFRIVGIYETGVPFEDGGGVISLRDAQSLFGQAHKVSFFNVWLRDPEQAQEIKDEIEARFPDVAVSPRSSFAEDVNDLRMTRASTWGIAFLALLVGGAGMMNTMVMSVFERTREIGVLRALGWRKRQVLWMILRESLNLSFLGGVGGVVVGIALSLMLNANPFMAGMVKARFSTRLVVQSLGTALALGAVGGLYPAWWASRLRPVEALRYE